MREVIRGYGKSTRQWLTLDDAMRFTSASWVGEPHITFDPNLVPQYRIRRRLVHDGTLAHTIHLMYKALDPLYGSLSYCKADGTSEADREGLDRFYTIGPIRLCSVFGRYDINGTMMSGQREAVTIPVRVDYRPRTEMRLTVLISPWWGRKSVGVSTGGFIVSDNPGECSPEVATTKLAQ